jgi:hypothetical protein
MLALAGVLLRCGRLFLFDTVRNVPLNIPFQPPKLGLTESIGLAFFDRQRKFVFSETGIAK